MTTKAAEHFVAERWSRMLAPENWHSLLTQSLPVDTVRQDVELSIANFTAPDDARMGCVTVAFRLGGRENPDLTAEEAEYVTSTLLSAARQVMRVYGSVPAHGDAA